MNPHGTSTKRHKPTISNNNHAAVDALRFIDQLDFYLWQASGDEQTVLSRIPSTLTNAQQVAWYNKLLASVSPRPLTLLDLRQALLADFGVDVKTARAVLARAGDAGYIHSLSFRVVLSYIDEIEAGKEREAKLAADRDSAGRKWRRVLVKAEDRYKAELREKQKLVEALGRRIEELELAVKGLTAIIAAKEGRDIAAAWARYESEEKAAREEFREVLSSKCAVGQAAAPTAPALPVSYRREESPSEEDDEDEMEELLLLEGSTISNAEALTKSSSMLGEHPLRKLSQNERSRVVRMRSTRTKPCVHIDGRDGPGRVEGGSG